MEHPGEPGVFFDDSLLDLLELALLVLGERHDDS